MNILAPIHNSTIINSIDHWSCRCKGAAGGRSTTSEYLRLGHTPTPKGRCISHPTGAVLQARLLDNQEDANTERYVFGKLSARCFQRRLFWHRHYSNCGGIEHGKSAQGCVIYTYIVYGVRAAAISAVFVSILVALGNFG